MNNRNNSQNNTNLTITRFHTKYCPWNSTKLSLILCYFLILVIGTCGNILVLTLFKKKMKKSVMNLLIMYLSAFDLFASLFVPFTFGYWVWTCDLEWHFGLFGCKVLPTLTRIFTSVSAGILVIMALERCRVIMSPFCSTLSRNTIHAAVLGTILVACISEIHYVTVLHLNENGECAVAGTRTYIYLSIFITLLRTVMFVGIFMSTTVLVTYKLKNKAVNGSQQLTRNVKLRVSRIRKAMKMLVVMMIVFGITVIPRDLFQISFILSYVLPIKFRINYSHTILQINSTLKILQTSNSIYNVFIYAGMYKGFIANALKLCKRVKTIKKHYTFRMSARKLEIENLNFLAPKPTKEVSYSSSDGSWL